MADKKTIERMLELVLKAADEKQTNAAYGGYHSDLGASEMRKNVNIYRAGQENKVPSDWVEYYAQAEHENDHEYETYLRLKKKFQ